MPRVVVDVPAETDRELRAAGLDPAEIVRESARKGLEEALRVARLDPEEIAQEDARKVIEAALAAARTDVEPGVLLRSRPPASSLDAIGVSATDTTGKIGVPVVRADEIEETDPR